ncbi:MAG: PspA-associated protein PspAB [Acidimicrobiales bacterium]
MGILDVILGRTKPAGAKLDDLFGLPGALITLEASENLVATNSAGVCYKPMAGQPFVKTEEEMRQLLGLAGTDGDDPSGSMRYEGDKYGYQWTVISSSDFQTLVTQVHLVNTTIEGEGYGAQLLCSVFGFHAGPDGSEGAPGSGSGNYGGSTYLVYLYKRGTFYPFVPLGGRERRDSQTELTLEAVLKHDLKIEPDKERWMPLWSLPVT